MNIKEKLQEETDIVIDELHALHHRYIHAFLNGHAKQVNRIVYPFVDKVILSLLEEVNKIVEDETHTDKDGDCVYTNAVRSRLSSLKQQLTGD